jgi:F0F1-type ATP synthase assembly protein I
MEQPDPQSDRTDGPPTDQPAERAPSLPTGAVEFLTLGLTLAVTIVVCAALGYLVDRGLGTSPIFTLVGLVLGIAAAVMTAVARIKKYL